MIFGRLITGAMVLVSGLAGAQLPEFSQQYRQRLGGAVDELRTIVERFDADARAENLDRTAALRRHLENADDLIKRRGRAMIDTIARHERLESFRKELAGSSSFALVMNLSTRMDGQIAQATWRDFQPAIPVTAEGGVLAAIGALFGWLLAKLLALPRRFLRREAAQGAQAR